MTIVPKIGVWKGGCFPTFKCLGTRMIVPIFQVNVACYIFKEGNITVLSLAILDYCREIFG
jgi:hypothetical protein